jgi:hypothetical protein
MKILKDFEGRTIRLTKERLQHIGEHPEMVGMTHAIEETLASPQKVIESLTDAQTNLYYRFYLGTRVGDKYLCVIVKMNPDDAFVLTAYLTNTIKKGRMLWPRRL